MLIKRIRKIISQIKENKLPVIMTLLDIIIERVFFKTTFSEYFFYDFYLKNRRARRITNTIHKNRLLWKKYNKASARDIVEDKSKFHHYYNKYISREFVDTRYASLEEIFDFINRHKVVIAKPVFGMQGKGIEIIDSAIIMDEIILKQKYNNYIFEELIKQHNALSKFNSSSINTVRFVTANDGNNNILLLRAVLRIGRKNTVTDNFSTGGIIANIDISTGVITGPVCDSNKNNYVYHPDSNEKIIGFKIPHYDMLIDTIKKAAVQIEGLNYLGWDIAITENGVDIVEVNHNPAARTIQVNQTGVYFILLQHLKGKNI